MKMHVCNTCGQSIEDVTWRNSFERDNKLCCRTCGGIYYDKEITSEERDINNQRSRVWAWVRTFWLEVLIILIVLSAFAGR